MRWLQRLNYYIYEENLFINGVLVRDARQFAAVEGISIKFLLIRVVVSVYSVTLLPQT